MQYSAHLCAVGVLYRHWAGKKKSLFLFCNQIRLFSVVCTNQPGQKKVVFVNFCPAPDGGVSDRKTSRRRFMGKIKDCPWVGDRRRGAPPFRSTKNVPGRGRRGTGGVRLTLERKKQSPAGSQPARQRQKGRTLRRPCRRTQGTGRSRSGSGPQPGRRARS